MFFLLSALAHAAVVNLQPGDDVQARTQGLNAGDELIFADGVYEIEGTVHWVAPGTEDAPVIFRAAQGASPVLRNIGSGHVAVLDDSTHVTVQGLTFEGGDGWDTEEGSTAGLLVRDSSDVSLKGLRIREVSSTGLRIEGDAARFVVTGNRIGPTREGSGIYVGCGDASCWLQDATLQGNWLHDLGGDGSHGIYLAPGGQNVEILDNVIYRVGDGEGGHGITTESTEFGEPNIIEGNAVWHVGNHGIWLEGSARVRNNIIFEVDGVGIGTRNDDRDGLSNVVISFNTVVETGDEAVYLGDWFHREGMVFTNNAIANPLGYGLYYDDDWEEGQTTSNYISTNHVTGLVQGFDMAVYPDWVVPGGGFSDFEDAASWDFYPRHDSPLINNANPAGEAWVPALDFNGTPRSGDGPDVGAYEWDRGGNLGWEIGEGFKELGPGTRSNDHDISSGCCGGSKAEGKSAGLFLPLLLLGWRRRRVGSSR